MRKNSLFHGIGRPQARYRIGEPDPHQGGIRAAWPLDASRPIPHTCTALRLVQHLALLTLSGLDRVGGWWARDTCPGGLCRGCRCRRHHGAPLRGESSMQSFEPDASGSIAQPRGGSRRIPHTCTALRLVTPYKYGTIKKNTPFGVCLAPRRPAGAASAAPAVPVHKSPEDLNTYPLMGASD